MTIAFFVILILNCFVIFAADALLGSVNNVNKTLVIEATTANSALINSLKSNAALYLTENIQQGALDLGFAEGNSFKVAHNESGKRTGRKGVEYPEDTSSSPKPEYKSPTLDKAPTSSATSANAISKNLKTFSEASSVIVKLPSPNNAATSITSTSVADKRKTISANSAEQLLQSSSSSTSTSTQSSSRNTKSTSKPTTIALKPMKPSIAYSVEDNPKLLEVPIQRLFNVAKDNPDVAVDLPISQPSRELQFDYQTTDRQQYVIPIIVLIFAVPMVLGMVTVFTRRFKHYWSTRHYRRMDFLVDGMYNT